MINVKYKRVYEYKDNKKTYWILIIYSISDNHVIGIPIYNEKKEKYIQSLDKYYNPSELNDYSKSHFIKCIYEKGQQIEISTVDYKKILHNCKYSILEFLNEHNNLDIDGISYLKWCRDKKILNEDDFNYKDLKQNGIYWINFGYNVGSELRKIRPAILWRSTGDKKLWTMIPLTTKNKNDNYYFHYGLKSLKDGTIKLENMMNFSYKRILAPYYLNHKLIIINNDDYDSIKSIIKKYYTFEKEIDINENNSI